MPQNGSNNINNAEGSIKTEIIDQNAENVTVTDPLQQAQETNISSSKTNQANDAAIQNVVQGNTGGNIVDPAPTPTQPKVEESNKPILLDKSSFVYSDDTILSPIEIDNIEKWNTDEAQKLVNSERAFADIPAANKFEGLTKRSTKRSTAGGSDDDHSIHNIVDANVQRKVISGAYNQLPDHDPRKRSNGNVLLHKGSTLPITGSLYFDDPKHMNAYGANLILFNKSDRNKNLVNNHFNVLRRGLYVLEGFRPNVGTGIVKDESYHKEVISEYEEKDDKGNVKATWKSSFIDDSNALFVVRDVTPLVGTVTQAAKDLVSAVTAIESRENHVMLRDAIKRAQNALTNAQTLTGELLTAMEFHNVKGINTLTEMYQHDELSCENEIGDINHTTYLAMMDQVMIDAFSAGNMSSIKERIAFDKKIEGRQPSGNSWWYSNQWELNPKSYIKTPGLLNVAAAAGSPNRWSTAGKLMSSFTQIWRDLGNLDVIFTENKAVSSIDKSVKVFKQALDALALALSYGKIPNDANVNDNQCVAPDALVPVLSFNPNDCVTVEFVKNGTTKVDGVDVDTGFYVYKPRLKYAVARSSTMAASTISWDYLYWQPIWIDVLTRALGKSGYVSKAFNKVSYENVNIDPISWLNSGNYFQVKFDHSKFSYFAYLYALAIHYVSVDAYGQGAQAENGVWRFYLSMMPKINAELPQDMMVNGDEYISTIRDMVAEFAKTNLEMLPDLSSQRYFNVLAGIKDIMGKVINGASSSTCDIDNNEDGYMATLMMPMITKYRQLRPQYARSPFKKATTYYPADSLDPSFISLKERTAVKNSTPLPNLLDGESYVLDSKFEQDIETALINHVFADADIERFNSNDDMWLKALKDYDDFVLIEPCHYYTALGEEGDNPVANLATYLPVIDDMKMLKKTSVCDKTKLSIFALRLYGDQSEVNAKAQSGFFTDVVGNILDRRLINALDKGVTSLPSSKGYVLPTSNISLFDWKTVQKFIADSANFEDEENFPHIHFNHLSILNLNETMDSSLNGDVEQENVMADGTVLNKRFRKFNNRDLSVITSEKPLRRTPFGLNNLLNLGNGYYKLIYPVVETLEESTQTFTNTMDIHKFFDRNYVYLVPAFPSVEIIGSSGSATPALESVFTKTNIRCVNFAKNNMSTFDAFKKGLIYKQQFKFLPPIASKNFWVLDDNKWQGLGNEDVSKFSMFDKSYYVNPLYDLNVFLVDLVSVHIFRPFFFINNKDWHIGKELFYKQLLAD